MRVTRCSGCKFQKWSLKVPGWWRFDCFFPFNRIVIKSMEWKDRVYYA